MSGTAASFPSAPRPDDFCAHGGRRIVKCPRSGPTASARRSPPSRQPAARRTLPSGSRATRQKRHDGRSVGTYRISSQAASPPVRRIAEPRNHRASAPTASKRMAALARAGGPRRRESDRRLRRRGRPSSVHLAELHRRGCLRDVAASKRSLCLAARSANERLRVSKPEGRAPKPKRHPTRRGTAERVARSFSGLDSRSTGTPEPTNELATTCASRHAGPVSALRSHGDPHVVSLGVVHRERTGCNAFRQHRVQMLPPRRPDFATSEGRNPLPERTETPFSCRALGSGSRARIRSCVMRLSILDVFKRREGAASVRDEMSTESWPRSSLVTAGARGHSRA